MYQLPKKTHNSSDRADPRLERRPLTWLWTEHAGQRAGFDTATEAAWQLLEPTLRQYCAQSRTKICGWNRPVQLKVNAMLCYAKYSNKIPFHVT